MKSEYSEEFDNLRKNRVKVSYYKYGSARKNFCCGRVDAVCGLCQFDGDFSCGESGYSITECPGFEKDDCFELKADFLEKYFKKGVKQ